MKDIGDMLLTKIYLMMRTKKRADKDGWLAESNQHDATEIERCYGFFMQNGKTSPQRKGSQVNGEGESYCN